MLTYDVITAAQVKYEELKAVKSRPEIAPVTVNEPGFFSRVSAEIRTAFARRPIAKPAQPVRRSLATK
jgi:hypothetical protein